MRNRQSCDRAYLCQPMRKSRLLRSKGREFEFQREEGLSRHLSGGASIPPGLWACVRMAFVPGGSVRWSVALWVVVQWCSVNRFSEEFRTISLRRRGTQARGVVAAVQWKDVGASRFFV